MNAAEMEDFIKDAYIDVFDIYYGVSGKSADYLEYARLFAGLRDVAIAALQRRGSLDGFSATTGDADRALDDALNDLAQRIEEILLNRGAR